MRGAISDDRPYRVSCACNRGDLRYRLGFDTENIINRGIDLSSIREQLKLVDGQQSIESRQQIGTTIHARVPQDFPGVRDTLERWGSFRKAVPKAQLGSLESRSPKFSG